VPCASSYPLTANAPDFTTTARVVKVLAGGALVDRVPGCTTDDGLQMVELRISSATGTRIDERLVVYVRKP